MAITDIKAYAHLTEADVEALAQLRGQGRRHRRGCFLAGFARPARVDEK